MDGPNPAAGAGPLASAVSVTGEGDPTASAKPGIAGTGGTRRLEEAGPPGSGTPRSVFRLYLDLDPIGRLRTYPKFDRDLCGHARKSIPARPRGPGGPRGVDVVSVRSRTSPPRE